MPYSEAFKQRMVLKMTGPNALSATRLANEEGLNQPTLSRWLREAGTLLAMTKKDNRSETKENGTTSPRRPQDWSLSEKLKVLADTAAIPSEELGAYLRKAGVHEAELEQWRQAVQEALQTPRRRRKRQTSEQKRIKELERELRRKEKALAEAAALLVLKKKAQAIWGDEDDDTDGESGS